MDTWLILVITSLTFDMFCVLSVLHSELFLTLINSHDSWWYIPRGSYNMNMYFVFYQSSSHMVIKFRYTAHTNKSIIVSKADLN